MASLCQRAFLCAGNGLPAKVNLELCTQGRSSFERNEVDSQPVCMGRLCEPSLSRTSAVLPFGMSTRYRYMPSCTSTVSGNQDSCSC